MISCHELHIPANPPHRLHPTLGARGAEQAAPGAPRVEGSVCLYGGLETSSTFPVVKSALAAGIDLRAPPLSVARHTTFWSPAAAARRRPAPASECVVSLGEG